VTNIKRVVFFNAQSSSARGRFINSRIWPNIQKLGAAASKQCLYEYTTMEVGLQKFHSMHCSNKPCKCCV